MPPRPDAARSEGGGSAFEQLLEFVPDAIVGVGRTGRIVLANRRAEDLFGYERELLVGKTPEVLVPERFRGLHVGHRAAYFKRPHTRQMGSGIELFAVRRDGTEFPVEVGLSTLEIMGETIATVAVRDVSQRVEGEREKVLQEQWQRAQRMESVGRLAGGIARDFNDTLGLIMNYAEFVAEELEDDSKAQRDVEEIRRAAERAAALTRQLLVFGRREATAPETLDLARVVGGLKDQLRRALCERIELTIAVEEGLSPVEADPGQMEQAVVNLSLNARDAMPEGGRLSIEAENVELDDEYAHMHPDTAPGSYVRLEVSDTGVGMDRIALERVFEPFYSTRDDRDGLGLATVYGIVAGAGGRIDVYSEPGFGTTVKIHLPAVAPAPHREPAAAESPGGRGEVVLVVAGEPDVTGMADRILSGSGYAVIDAANAAEAIALCEHGTRIDLLLTEAIMPQMLGPELVERVRSTLPDLRAIYTSGHSRAVLDPHAPLDRDGCAFVEQPFDAATLLRATRALLDGPARTTG